MPLPEPVLAGVEAALGELGLGTSVTSSVPVGGGCINNGAALVTDRGRTLFVKWNPSAPPPMFEAEAEGLNALRAARTLRVPEPLAHSGQEDNGIPWLLMEHIPSGPAASDTDTRLGKGLAAIHATHAADTFGWERDNWIGSLQQSNKETLSWASFWRDERIVPQMRRARDRGFIADRVMDRLVDVIPRALDDVTCPGLVHGDLWAGNSYPGPDGEPVVIDPAAYRGHGEVDVAMSELFGGFGPRFYEAYQGVCGLEPEYRAFRRDLYQLYYLLVHVNLFGASYEPGCLAAARKVVAELS